MTARTDDFIALSVTLTGFPAADLAGTGQAEAYMATAAREVGGDTLAALLDAHARAAGEAGGDDAALDAALRRHILSDPRLGPVARNIIKLWYVGTWYEMPSAWRVDHGPADASPSHVVSPQAYTEGLLWPAVGANPSGAKPFGYGMWALPPRVSLD